jgi:hypothetical protein
MPARFTTFYGSPPNLLTVVLEELSIVTFPQSIDDLQHPSDGLVLHMDISVSTILIKTIQMMNSPALI